jgi:hypothetical protein
MTLVLLLQQEYADSLTSDSYEELVTLGSARAEWTFALADKNGALTEILDPGVIGAELQVARSEPSTLELTLSGDDDRAYRILQQATITRPLCYAYRDGFLEFAGYLSAVKESGDEGLEMRVTFSDALATLQHRLTDYDYESYNEDAVALIAGTPTLGTSLVAQANAVGATGLEVGNLTSGITIETFTTSRDVVYDKVREIIGQTNGPDVRVRPQAGSATFGILDVGTLYKGTSIAAYFGYGGTTIGNLTAFEWEITPPQTRVICIGNDVEGASKITTAVTVAEAKLGIWQGVISNNDLYLPDDCVDAANAAVRTDWTATISFTPDPALAPRPLRDYEVGDLISVRASRGSLLYNGTPRIRAIQISIDENGTETAHRVDCEAGGTPTDNQASTSELSIGIYSTDASNDSAAFTSAYL